MTKLTTGDRVDNVETVSAGDRTRVEWSASFEFPYRISSGANLREHWRVTSARKKKEKAALYFAWVGAMRPTPPCWPVVVTFVRGAPLAESRPMDDDNLVIAFKHMRDQLAECLGLKGDAKKQGYESTLPKQEKRAEYIVRVEMRAEGVRGARP